MRVSGWLTAAMRTALVTGCGSSSALSSTGNTSLHRSINRGLTLRPGSARQLYSVRGFHYGTVGLFTASCTRAGLAETRYVVGRLGPDAAVTEDGRGASGGATLVSP